MESQPASKKLDKMMRVMVVDDVDLTTKVLSATLKEIGFRRVVRFNSALKALMELEQEAGGKDAYKLIFSDINMPDMDGIKFLKEIRKSRLCGNIPVIMVSAQKVQETILEAVDAGASNYIIKPFSKEQLEERISKIFFHEKL